MQTSDGDVSGGAHARGAGAVAGLLRVRGYCAGSGMGLSSISSAKGAAMDINYVAGSFIDTRRRRMSYFKGSY
jgi:hypothetical protein